MPGSAPPSCRRDRIALPGGPRRQPANSIAARKCVRARWALATSTSLRTLSNRTSRYGRMNKTQSKTSLPLLWVLFAFVAPQHTATPVRPLRLMSLDNRVLRGKETRVKRARALILSSRSRTGSGESTLTPFGVTRQHREVAALGLDPFGWPRGFLRVAC